jgi:hypothetical protein
VRIALRYLGSYAGFGLGLGTGYYLLTDEWVGSTMLWLLGAMPAIVGLWWLRAGSSPAVRASDDPDAGEPASAAGESLGWFPATTGWPVFLVLGVIVTGASLVYGLLLLPVGAVLVIWALIGLVRESRG